MEDSKIVDMFWKRSERAISESSLKYGAYCRNIAYNILESGEDSEECVNDTWLRAWNSMPSNKPAKLGAYLGRITRNLALTRLRDSGRMKRGGGEVALALEELAECIPSDSHRPEYEAEYRETADAIRKFVSGLSKDERIIFVGRYWYLATIAEISKKLAFKQSRVASSLHRTRKKLAEYLAEEGLI